MTGREARLQWGKMRSVRTYVGLGANLGDRAETLTAAIRALDGIPGLRVVAVSRLYATRPAGPPGQPEYLNAVAALDVRLPGAAPEVAAALLGTLKDLEARFGRKSRERWAPRELDLDLLVFGRHSLALTEPSLTVPHRLARERLFVLAPLRDLAPGLRPPGWGETVERAYARQLAAEGSSAVRPIEEWDPAAARWDAKVSARRRVPA